MLARCTRYPAVTDRTLRLFPYFYFSQYSTRARAIRQRIARCAFSHISIFLNTAPAPAYPSATDRALRLFPYFYFSQYGTRSRAIRQRIARCAFSHISIFFNTEPAPAPFGNGSRVAPFARAHEPIHSKAHRLKFKCSSTQIQMPIDSNSKAHRLKFKCSSTQMPKNETPPGEEMRKSSGKNARHSIRVGNTSSNNIVPRSVPSG